MKRVRWAAVTGLGLLLACDGNGIAPTSDGTGDIALHIALSAHAQAVVDRGLLHLEGPETRSNIAIQPGGSVDINGLRVGSYTVNLEAFGGSVVEEYGTGNVTVLDEQTSPVTITPAPFVVLGGALSGGTLATCAGDPVNLAFTGTQGADRYRVQWTPTSGGTQGSADLAGSGRTITAPAPGEYTLQVRAVTKYSNSGPWSAPVTLQVADCRQPQFSVDPDTLRFGAPEGSNPTPNTQTLTVRNSGGGTLNWTASENADWMVVAPTSGTLDAGQSASVAVTVTSNTLAANDYAELITFTDGAASNSPYSVRVELAVGPVPLIGVSPARLSFSATVGSDPNPNSRTFTVTNTGSGTLNWTASEDQSWITSVTPDSGALGQNESATVTVTVSTASLGAGNYTGPITIADPNAANTPQQVTVTAAVGEQPSIGLNPSSLSYSATEGSNPPTQTLTITNVGGGTLQWSASSNQSWLAVSPTSGQLGHNQSRTVTVTVTSAGLAAGNYSGVLTFTDPNASNSPQTVSVSLTVAPGGLQIQPSPLPVTTLQGENPNPRTISFTITNASSQTLNVSASSSTSWIGSLTVQSPNLGAGQSTTASFSANTVFLGAQAGPHTGRITVTGGPYTETLDLPLTVLDVSQGGWPAVPDPLSWVSQPPNPVTFQWVNNSNDADFFEIERFYTGSSWSAYDTIQAPASQYTDPSPPVAQLLQYRIRACSNQRQPACNIRSRTVTTSNVPNPALSLSTTSLAFTAPQGGGHVNYQTPQLEETQHVWVKNTGGGSLNWTASSGAGWLRVSPTSGSLAAGDSAQVSITKDQITATFTTSTYNGGVTFSDGSNNHPLDVTLTIGAGPPAVSSGIQITSVSTSAVAFQWTNHHSGDATHIQIESWDAVNKWHVVDQIGPNETSYTASGFPSGVAVQYRVRTCNGTSQPISNPLPAGCPNQALTPHPMAWPTRSAKGTVRAGGARVSGAAITLRKCLSPSSGANPPQAGVCSTYDPAFTAISVNTDGQGEFAFEYLESGIYEVNVNPASVGFTGVSTNSAGTLPAGSVLYHLTGNSGGLSVCQANTCVSETFHLN